MAYENTAGLGVTNQYGPRDTGTTVGVETDKDSIHTMGVAFTHRSLQDAFMSPFVLPRGAKILRYLLRVDEAFTMTGTTPTLIVGGTAPATDGVVVTAAELAAVGTKTPASTGTGTWALASATGTTAAQRVTKALGGTTPAVTVGAGRATLMVEYIFKTKV
jgi:hypothetical protein